MECGSYIIKIFSDSSTRTGVRVDLMRIYYYDYYVNCKSGFGYTITTYDQRLARRLYTSCFDGLMHLKFSRNKYFILLLHPFITGKTVRAKVWLASEH